MKLHISIKALIKLLVFFVAKPGIGALLPKPVIYPACTDLTWDENDTGFQSKICTMPRPSSIGGASQSSLTKRTNRDLDDNFAFIFSGLTTNATEAGSDICPPASNTTTASDIDGEDVEQSDELSEITDYDTNIKRRSTCGGGGPYPLNLPYRTPLSDIEATSSKTWCYHLGPPPNKDHVANLCRSVEQLHFPNGRIRPNIPFQDDFVVQRARGPARPGNTTVEYQDSCVCVTGRERTAGFKVCNCDRCDSLIINYGLAKMCKLMERRCTKNGYSSGYIKSNFEGAMYNGIISLFTFPESKGAKEQPVELDPILAREGTVFSTCRSGDEGRKLQDYSGPVMDCRRKEVPKVPKGRYCRDMVAGGQQVFWVKEEDDRFKALRGKPQKKFPQFGKSHWE